MKKGLLQTDNGHVLKAVQSPPRGLRELEFYKKIFESKYSELNNDEIELRKILPEFCNTIIHNDGIVVF